MSAVECREELDEDKAELLTRYNCGRKDENGPNVCTLIGVAIGSPMKIRWKCIVGLICTLDVRTAADHGSEPTTLESAFNAELSSNRKPNMSELPQGQSGRTEMTLRWSEQLNQRIEKQYLSYCDKEVPLDFTTAASTRLILAPGMLMQTNYRRACDEEQSDAMWRTVDEIYRHWRSEPDIYRDRRWRLIEKLRFQAFTARGRRQAISQLSRATQPDHITTSERYDPSNEEEAAAHAHPPPVTGVQTTESNPSAEQPLPMGTLVNAAAATAATQPLGAALFGMFWDLIGYGQGASVSWL
ncbi:hypothetical protein BDV40DRAFT_289667 [Aspergillus tamarii]|uniref:Uncharacterized protein n=1 Tax=Aspergillus tamarii TaxID=41984 RepID=A0A5N6UQZ6_ASPTM|nr:hypothetical protein BDV40DRAFT_289667 [Aspergillus tamarii]